MGFRRGRKAGAAGCGCLVLLMVVAAAGRAEEQKGKHERSQAAIMVATSPGVEEVATQYEDRRYHVRFTVPPGWQLSRRDGEVSTFHMDARSARPNGHLRSVASLNFNPFPTTTLSGALVYFSVTPQSSDLDCAQQAYGKGPKKDVRNIGGVPFTHGHDEHGGMCTEARDEIYTSYHRHACYRFDLSINTFCGVYSGAQDISDAQLDKVRERMVSILSSVKFDWEKGEAEVGSGKAGGR